MARKRERAPGNEERPSVNGDGNGVNNPSIHFGNQVKKARLGNGWSIQQLADEAGISGAHISRLERGLSKSTERVAGKLDKVFPDRRGWFSDYHRDSRYWAPPGYLLWGEYETSAMSLRVWCPGVLHGLVQIEQYTRAHFESVSDVPSEVIDARVQARMERQRRVLHRDDPPDTWFGVDELSLYCQIGSADTMAAQLGHLLTVAALPHVVLQVVPPIGRPALTELIVTDSAAYTEHVAGGMTFTDTETVTSMGRLLSRMQGECYRVSESVRLIERIRDTWARGVHPLTQLHREGPA